MNHIAGEELKLTDYLSRHPTGNAVDETEYEEEYVINALVPLIQMSNKVNGLTNHSASTENNKFTYVNETTGNMNNRPLAEKINSGNQPIIQNIQSDISIKDSIDPNLNY